MVYEAEQISLNRRVALKTLPLAAVLDPKQLTRFQERSTGRCLARTPSRRVCFFRGFPSRCALLRDAVHRRAESGRCDRPLTRRT